MLKEFWAEEEAMAVVDILLILAVIIIIALLFRKTIVKWVEDILAELFPDKDGILEGTDDIY